MNSLGFWKRPNKRAIITGPIVLGLIIIGFATWFQGGKATQQQPGMSPQARQQAEGKSEGPVSDSLLASYKVADYLPRIITIEKLGVTARVLPMGVNPDGSMQAPLNINDSGWYTKSARPDTPGAIVIDGHVRGPTKPGIFDHLDTLVAGDVVTLEKGDRETLEYRVVKVKTVPLDAVNMNEVLRPYTAKTESLNLISCTGTWQKDKKTFDKRVLVFAEQTKAAT